MQNQWSLADRSRHKRSNEGCAGLCVKRQRRSQSLLERVDECEDVAQIRGGLARPRPPSLGPPPNRATSSQENTTSSQANTTNTPPKQPPKVGSSTTPGQGTPHLPTPPDSHPSNKKQGGATGAGTGAGGPSSTATAPSIPDEDELLDLFDKLQAIVFLWVDECLPDTFPEEFQTEKPERYWELCGWCKPMTLGGRLLQDRSMAKYVYESWVWRFLHQEIFQLDSLAWAGHDVPAEQGGLGGLGKSTNSIIDLILKQKSPSISQKEYETHTRDRAGLMQQVRDGFVTQDQKDRSTGWLIEEMLVAFHPYFADEYKPIDNPQNIEVLIRDTRFLILKAQELDEKLRSAGHVYETFHGTDGDVCRVSGLPSPTMQSYDASKKIRIFHNDDFIALIVVPGLVKYLISEQAGGSVSPLMEKELVLYARAFTQSDLLEALEQ